MIFSIVQGNYSVIPNDFIKRLENAVLANDDLSKLAPYADPSIAIGYGFDLLKRSNAEINAVLSAVNARLGTNPPITLSSADQTLLAKYRGGQITQTQLLSSLSIRLPSETYALEIVNYLAETQFESVISLSKLPESNERVAVMSVLYNLGAAGAPKLLELINTGADDPAQRAKIWYEIRYNSNLNRLPGLANRHYKESELFSLYDNVANVAEREAKAVLAVFTENQTEIRVYETRFNPGAVSSFAIKDKLAPADRILIATYGRGALIEEGQTRVLVGTEKSESTILAGSNENNLLFGEGGDDLIDGGGGSDVIYGGTGDDVIFGRQGNDILIGDADRGSSLAVKGPEHAHFRSRLSRWPRSPAWRRSRNKERTPWLKKTQNGKRRSD